MKFRKKPVIIEAFRFGIDDFPEWAIKAIESNIIAYDSKEFNWCDILTLEGIMRGKYGDYIIKGVQGEIYSCKRDIFTLTYEQVD